MGVLTYQDIMSARTLDDMLVLTEAMFNMAQLAAHQLPPDHCISMLHDIENELADEPQRAWDYHQPDDIHCIHTSSGHFMFKPNPSRRAGTLRDLRVILRQRLFGVDGRRAGASRS